MQKRNVQSGNSNADQVGSEIENEDDISTFSVSAADSRTGALGWHSHQLFFVRSSRLHRVTNQRKAGVGRLCRKTTTKLTFISRSFSCGSRRWSRGIRRRFVWYTVSGRMVQAAAVDAVLAGLEMAGGRPLLIGLNRQRDAMRAATARSDGHRYFPAIAIRVIVS